MPLREIEVRDINAGAVHRVAMVSSGTQATPGTTSTVEQSCPEEQNGPPVERGEVVDVEIKKISKQEDGIAREGPGYAVIIPRPDMGEVVDDVEDKLASTS